MCAQTRLLEVAKNGVIPVLLEEDVVRSRVGHLYADPASAIRELYANELRACRTAQDRFHANPRIEITVDISDRSIVIHGIDSLGITEEKFVNVLSVLGETDNTDGAEIGQWGWGVASYVSISDSILFETYARETGEKFTMLGINGEHFSRLPEPDLNSPGTRVTVYVKENFNIQFLAERARKICRYADVDTYLRVIGQECKQDPFAIRWQRADDMLPDEFEKINNPALSAHLPYGTLVTIEDEDFQFAGVLTPSQSVCVHNPHSAWPSRLSKSEPCEHVDIRLVAMPIRADQIRLPFDAWTLAIEDERKYSPTADRERLKDDAATKILEKLAANLQRVLPSVLDIESFNDFRKKPGKYIYTHDTLFDKDGLGKYYTPSQRTCEVSNLLSMRFDVLGDSERAIDQSLLGDIVARSENIFLVDSLDRKLQDLLRERYGDAVLIKRRLRNSPADGMFSVERVSALLAQGIRTDAHIVAEEIKREIAASREATPRPEPLDESHYSVIIHSTRIRQVEEHGIQYDRLADKAEAVNLTQVVDKFSDTFSGDTFTVFVPTIEKFLPILEQVNSDCGLSRLDKLPKHLRERKMTLQRFLKEQASRKIPTNRGQLTFKAIVKSQKPITILTYDDPRIISVYPKKDELFTALRSNEAFLLALYLTALDKPYQLNLIPSEWDFGEATGHQLHDYHHRENHYDKEIYHIINIAFHIGLATKDKRLRELFLVAAQNFAEVEHSGGSWSTRCKHKTFHTLPDLRNFVLEFPTFSK